MAKETPLFLQNGVYPARLDRHLIEELFRRRNRVIDGFVVTQRGAGADFSVDVTAGAAVILGNTETSQGAYLIRSTATENVAVPPTPLSAQTDELWLVVRDPTAGGASGDDWVFAYVEEGDPAPDNALLIATIERSPSESAIVDAAITDVAPRGAWSWTVGSGAPTHNAPEGDLYVQVG